MNAFIAKPFTLAQLQLLLARWLPAAAPVKAREAPPRSAGALRQFRADTYDLVMLDVDMPVSKRPRGLCRAAPRGRRTAAHRHGDLHG